LKVMDLILTNDLGHAPAPGSVTNLLWYALTNETVALRVMPGPYWVTNNPAAAASLFDWTTNNVALPVPTDLTMTLTPTSGSNVVNVSCLSPYPATPTNQTTTINGVAMQSETDKHLIRFPSTRTTIGVGEEVKLWVISPPPGMVDWTVEGGGSLITNETPVVLKAPPIGTSNCMVTARFQNGLAVSKTFVVLEPTGIASAVITTTDPLQYGYQIPYPTGGVWSAGACMVLTAYVAPLGVSFSKVQMAEGPGPASSVTGYFSSFSTNSLYHWPNPSSHTELNFFSPNTENAFSDRCGVSPLFWVGPWGQGGSFQWDIPAVWYVPGGPTNSFGGAGQAAWQQYFTLDANGTVSIRKFGCIVTRGTNGVVNAQNPTP
jgi:hypothetical protein